MKLINDVINTYECLISCRKKMPEMKLEDVFTQNTLLHLELELEFLKRLDIRIKIG